MIKPIPTEYNGVLYRSKLEAKWAAYFDMCGAKYEYEPQAFDLGDGVKYLPDFCVKNVLSVHGKCGGQTLENSLKYEEFWFECKGVMSDYDAEKIRRFCDQIDREKYMGGCYFYVLDRSPLEMFCDYENFDGSAFSFYGIDGDEYDFVIGKQSGRTGIGLFGADSNYQCLMDCRSREFAKQTEHMFHWTPSGKTYG